MRLDIQILSFLYSYIYGLVLFYLFSFNNRIVYRVKLVYKIIISMMFVLCISLSYFVILLYINNGYIHIYFYIFILLGYLSMSYFYKKYFT